MTEPQHKPNCVLLMSSGNTDDAPYMGAEGYVCTCGAEPQAAAPRWELWQYSPYSWALTSGETWVASGMSKAMGERILAALTAQADAGELAERRQQDPLLGQGYSASAYGGPTQGDGEGTENIYQSHVDRAELSKLRADAGKLAVAVEALTELRDWDAEFGKSPQRIAGQALDRIKKENT